MKKEQIMESYFQKYGVASSVAELSGILHKRFPNKSTDFKQDARDFITRRISEHRVIAREEYHYHENNIRHAWNPKYMKAAIIREFREMAEYVFTHAFEGLAYQEISK